MGGGGGLYREKKHNKTETIEQFTCFINDVAMLRLVVGNTKYLVTHSHRYSYALLK